MTAYRVEHQVQADGYCGTCLTVPCRLSQRPRTEPGTTSQLDRIELLLHRIARAVGVDPDHHQTSSTKPTEESST